MELFMELCATLLQSPIHGGPHTWSWSLNDHVFDSLPRFNEMRSDDCEDIAMCWASPPCSSLHRNGIDPTLCDVNGGHEFSKYFQESCVS